MAQARRGAGFAEVLRVREFRALWAADLLSVLGDQLARVTLAVLVYGRTSSALLTALTYALTFLPAIVGGMALSGLADRFPRRTVMVATDALRAVLAGAMAVPGLPLPALWVLLAVLSCAAGPFKAAQLALIPQVLSGPRYVTGLALRQVTGQTAQLVGFAAGGSLLLVVEPHVGLAVNAATYVASALLVLTGVKSRPAARISTERVRVGRTRVPAPLVVLVLAIGLYVVPEGIAAPYAHGLGLGSLGVGLLMAADPVGSVLGGWMLARLKLTASIRGAGLLACAAGLPLAACLVHPGLVVSLVLWALSGAGSTAYLIQTQALVVDVVPDERRGRVLGRMSTGMYASQGAAILLGGLLAQLRDAATAVAVSGALAALVALVVALDWWSARPRSGRGARPEIDTNAVSSDSDDSGHQSLFDMMPDTSSPRSSGDIAPTTRSTVPASTSMGDAAPSMSLRGWKLWKLPRTAVTLVIAVVAIAAAVTVIDWLAFPISQRALADGAIIVALGLLTAEITRGVERMRRRFSDTPHINMSSVWTLSAAIATTPGLAVAIVVILYTHLGLRSWQRINGVGAHKIVYNASVVALSCCAASAVLHLLPAWAAPDVDRPTGLLGLVAVIAVYSVVNSVLVGAVIAASRGERSPRKLLGGWLDNSLEYATLCVGMMAALLLQWRPWLVVLVLLPLYVLHRSVLVRQFEHAATTDAKTGLLNAASWHSLAVAELDRARRAGGQLTVMMADLDHFKRVNDGFGHLAGDEVLRAVAEAVSGLVPGDGLCGRFGGEEFVIALPGMPIGDAVALANRIRQAVRSLSFDLSSDASTGPEVSVSIGIANHPDTGNDLDELLRAADNALFLAKDRGRDQVQAVQALSSTRRRMLRTEPAD